MTTKMIRYARIYDDGSMNVGSGGETEEEAIKKISGSSDDDDTQLAEIEVRLVRWITRKGLTVVKPNDVVRDVLEQALDCLRGDPPEDYLYEEAREDTIQKIRDVLKTLGDGTPRC